MKRFATLCAITIALTLTACNQTADTPTDADVKAVQDNETQWNQDWAAKDQDKIVAHYADDAVLMVSGTPSAPAKKAISVALKPMTSDPPALSLKFHASNVEVAKSGDVAYTQGTYTLTLTDTPRPNNHHRPRQLRQNLPQAARWHMESGRRHRARQRCRHPLPPTSHTSHIRRDAQASTHAAAES